MKRDVGSCCACFVAVGGLCECKWGMSSVFVLCVCEYITAVFSGGGGVSRFNAPRSLTHTEEDAIVDC